MQIGEQVYEDMPQEMRSRLWYALLERPELAHPFRVGGLSQQRPMGHNFLGSHGGYNCMKT